MSVTKDRPGANSRTKRDRTIENTASHMEEHGSSRPFAEPAQGRREATVLSIGTRSDGCNAGCGAGRASRAPGIASTERLPANSLLWATNSLIRQLNSLFRFLGNSWLTY